MNNEENQEKYEMEVQGINEASDTDGKVTLKFNQHKISKIRKSNNAL